MAAADFVPQRANTVQTWMVRIGGVTRAELLSRLQRAGVLLNEAAETLFADDRFTTSLLSTSVEVVSFSVAELGFPDGASFGDIVERANNIGLLLCPLEVGPHLRLQFIYQPEGFIGQPVSQNCAPPGSLTVASAPLAQDDDSPKGFYLRRIEGALWLRGYRSWAGHIWSPRDRLAFVRDQDLATSSTDR
jgi:hypothetical protein